MNQAQNTFSGGLSMDTHPLTTPNSSLTNCLNGTILTFNGNEYMLLNDMGNGRVETAYLPSGYIPLGTTSFGGIIYIVSYNPETNKSLIGCFPSPERNFTEEDRTNNDITTPTLSQDSFISNDGNINNQIIKIKLSDISLNPGDKYLISATGLSDNKLFISDYNNSNNKCEIGTNPKYIRFRVATSDSSGRLVYLDSDIKWYQLLNDDNEKDSTKGYYYILNKADDIDISTDTLSNYRTAISSPYSIFTSKLSGELYIIAELETIDTFGYTYKVDHDENYKIYIQGEWTSENWNDELKGIDPYGVKITYNWEKESDLNTNDVKFYDEEYQTVIQSGDSYNEGNVEGRYSSKEIICDTINKYNYSSLLQITETTDPKIINFTLTPYMEYGLIDSLKVSGSIDLSKVGSGAFNINMWRYYVSDDSVWLSYGFDSYPEDGKIVSGIKFDFYNVTNISGTTFPETPDYSYKNTGRNSYAGNFSTEFFLNETGKLYSNNLYLVVISRDYGTKSEHNFEIKDIRFLYTSLIFNDKYLDGNTLDFNSLKISDIDITLNLNSNISQLKPTIKTDAGSINQDLGNTNQTQINKLIEETTGTTTYSFDGLKLKICPNLTTDSEMFTIKNVPIQTNIVTKNNDGKISPVLTNSELLVDTSGFTYNDISIGDYLLDSFDTFQLTKTDDDTIDNEYIYSINFNPKNKIVSTSLFQKSIQYTGLIKPVIYDESDLAKYNIQFNSETNHFEFINHISFMNECLVWTVSLTTDTKLGGGYYCVQRIGDAIGNGDFTYNALDSGSRFNSMITDHIKTDFGESSIVPYMITTNSENVQRGYVNDRLWGPYGWNAYYGDNSGNVISAWAVNNGTSVTVGNRMYEHLYKFVCNGDGYFCSDGVWKPGDSGNYPWTSIEALPVGTNRGCRFYICRNAEIPGGLFFQTTEGDYIWTGNMFMYNPSKTIGTLRIGLENLTIADELVNFLGQTYIYTSDNAYITEMRPNNVAYYPSYTLTITIPTTSNYTILESNIYIDDIDINTLQSNLKNLLLTNKDTKDLEIEYNNISFDQIKIDGNILNLSYSLNVEDNLYDFYMSTIVDKLIVKNTMNKEGMMKNIVLDSDNYNLSTTKLYTWDSKNNKLYDISKMSKQTITYEDIFINYKNNSETLTPDNDVCRKNVAIGDLEKDNYIYPMVDWNNTSNKTKRLDDGGIIICKTTDEYLYPNNLDILVYDNNYVKIKKNKYLALGSNSLNWLHSGVTKSGHGSDRHMYLTNINLEFSIGKQALLHI